MNVAAPTTYQPARRVAVVVGTRPEIIKLAPVIREIDARCGRGTALVIHTGQHYDRSMSGQFWPELGLASPELRLDAGGLGRARCVGYLIAELASLFEVERPDAVVVQGDTNTTVAAAFAANAAGVRLVHVEAGLRSNDRAMPEEHNRVVTDHLADLCCAPTAANVANLLGEGVPAERIVLTGNTVVEAVGSQFADGSGTHDVLEGLGLAADGFVLATLHRPENTDDPAVLASILEALARIAGRTIAGAPLPVVVPLHPRTVTAAKEAGCDGLLDQLTVIDPVGARAFLALLANAAVTVSDSGGVAEEVTVVKRPLVVVRRSTERQESIDAGFAQLVGPDGIEAAVTAVLEDHAPLTARLAATPSPYGDGHASSRIVTAVLALLDGDALRTEPKGI